MKMIIVQTTTDNKKEAKKIAKVLLKNKLCACVQISKVKSFYYWNGKLCEDKERILSIKTKKSCFKKIQRKIKENHSYDLPEIIAIPIKKSSKEYKNFVGVNTI